MPLALLTQTRADRVAPFANRRTGRSAALVCLVTVLAITSHARAEEVDSGLQVGERGAPFNVKDCTGPAAGKTLCYFCRYGSRPVVAIYVDRLGPSIGDILENLDRLVEQQRDRRAAAFLVYTGRDSARIERQLQELSRSRKIKHVPLTILRESREQLRQKFAIRDVAEFTLLTWRDARVQHRLAFDTTDLRGGEVEQVRRTMASFLEGGDSAQAVSP